MAKTKFWNVDKIMSVSAVFVGVCALIVSLVQTKVMKEQQEASVWPYVETLIKSGTEDNLNGIFEISFHNKGVGPAIILNAKIVFGGKEYPESDFLKIIRDIAQLDSLSSYRSNMEGRVMAANEEGTILKITDPKQAYKINEAFAKAQKDFEIIICYSNIYGKTWQVGRNVKAREVTQCE